MDWYLFVLEQERLREWREGFHTCKLLSVSIEHMLSHKTNQNTHRFKTSFILFL